MNFIYPIDIIGLFSSSSMNMFSLDCLGPDIDPDTCVQGFIGSFVSRQIVTKSWFKAYTKHILTRYFQIKFYLIFNTFFDAVIKLYQGVVLQIFSVDAKVRYQRVHLNFLYTINSHCVFCYFYLLQNFSLLQAKRQTRVC